MERVTLQSNQAAENRFGSLVFLIRSFSIRAMSGPAVRNRLRGTRGLSGAVQGPAFRRQGALIR